MLRSLLDRLAGLLDPDQDLHAGDDAHGLAGETFEDERW
jgi:hypothetical protein